MTKEEKEVCFVALSSLLGQAAEELRVPFPEFCELLELMHKTAVECLPEYYLSAKSDTIQ